MPLHRQAVLLRHTAVERRIQFDLVQIHYRSAAAADKVAVRHGDTVKPLLAIYHSHALNQSLLLEQTQIPIDCSQTQVRVGWLQGLIDPLGGRVDIRCPDGI